MNKKEKKYYENYINSNIFIINSFRISFNET